MTGTGLSEFIVFSTVISEKFASFNLRNCHYISQLLRFGNTGSQNQDPCEICAYFPITLRIFFYLFNY